MALDNVHPAEIIHLEIEKKKACAKAGIEYQRDYLAEQRILKDPENALLYARSVLEGRWPELEDQIAEMSVDLEDISDFSHEVWGYVFNVAKRPVPALEKHFLHNREIADFYEGWSPRTWAPDTDIDNGVTKLELARSRDGRLISEFENFWPGAPARVLELTPPVRAKDFEGYIVDRIIAHRQKLGLDTELSRPSRWKTSGGNPSSDNNGSSTPPSSPTLELTPPPRRRSPIDDLPNRIEEFRTKRPVDDETKGSRWKKQEPDPSLPSSPSPIGWKRDSYLPSQPKQAGPGEESRWPPKMDSNKDKDHGDEPGPTLGM